jgi:hypothetical protein
MEKNRRWGERAQFFFLGILAAVALLLLTGAVHEPPPPNFGRYQIAAWGDAGAHGAFVTDTTTGETRIVYRYKQINADEAKVRNYLQMPFHRIRE